jgi:hypothetical protein
VEARIVRIELARVLGRELAQRLVLVYEPLRVQERKPAQAQALELALEPVELGPA